jgi:hypothetical protein
MPLPATMIHRIAAALEQWPFARIFGAFVGREITENTRAIVQAAPSCSRGGDLWSRGQLRQIVGDGEPRRLARDVDMLRRPNARIIVECAERQPIIVGVRVDIGEGERGK